jgi:hypothetical protein
MFSGVAIKPEGLTGKYAFIDKYLFNMQDFVGKD